MCLKGTDKPREKYKIYLFYLLLHFGRKIFLKI